MGRQVTCLVPGHNMETYHGHVRTPQDAIILFEACRVGLLPRVQRRLSEKERQSIKSGSIFLWDEREAGMRRWTDGKSWSASRVTGSFLTYREMEGKRGGSGLSAPLFSGNNIKSGRDSIRGSDGDSPEAEPDGYRYKSDGLIKQSFSITTSSGQHLHLISYLSRSLSISQNLVQPSTDPQLRHIQIKQGMYPESTAQDQTNIPAVTRGAMSGSSFASSPQQSTNGSTESPYNRGSASLPVPYGAYMPPGRAPPSPMHTPPQAYMPYYNGHQHPHHQQYQHHPHPPPPPYMGQPQHPPPHGAYQPYPHPYSAPPPTAYDRPPAPPGNGGYPPTLPPYQGPYQDQDYRAPSRGDQHHGMQSPAPYPRPYESRPPTQQHTPAPLNIDPKLENTLSRQDSVLPPRDEPVTSTAPNSRPPAPTTSSATTIPSISSLINSTQPAPSEPLNGRRSGSHSPKDQQQRQTQDIPLHKIGFAPNRDARALRDLDNASLRF